MADTAIEAEVRRRGAGLALALPVGWLLRRYGRVPEALELLCGGRRVAARLVRVTAKSAWYYVRGAGQLALLEAEECAPAR